MRNYSAYLEIYKGKVFNSPCLVLANAQREAGVDRRFYSLIYFLGVSCMLAPGYTLRKSGCLGRWVIGIAKIVAELFLKGISVTLFK